MTRAKHVSPLDMHTQKDFNQRTPLSEHHHQLNRNDEYDKPPVKTKSVKSRWLSRWSTEHHEYNQGETKNRLMMLADIAIDAEKENVSTLEYSPKIHPITFSRPYQHPEGQSRPAAEHLNEALQGYEKSRRYRHWHKEIVSDGATREQPHAVFMRPAPKRSKEAAESSDYSAHNVGRERPRKRARLEHAEEVGAPSSSNRADDRLVGSEVKGNVQKLLATAGVTPESIIGLINNQENRTSIIQQTGFSNNYIMKLQRKVLRSSEALQLQAPHQHQVVDKQVHIVFDADGTALFIKKELCDLLAMKGTTFSYWKKKANAEEIDTSQDFRLMDKCRSIFGGRSTYTLYTAEATLSILREMETSRQKGAFRAAILEQLIDLARRYAPQPDRTQQH